MYPHSPLSRRELLSMVFGDHRMDPRQPWPWSTVSLSFSDRAVDVLPFVVQSVHTMASKHRSFLHASSYLICLLS